MNPPELPVTPTIVAQPAQSTDPFLHCLRRLLAHNPFYIISAALLLYGIYRLSIDPKIFASEVGQLFFNFGSFQLYEVLLVVTAVVLARRQIWYDSSLLVCLENLFVFIPFILISQALLIENHIAATFCFLASTLVVLRFGALKKLFVKINLPPRLLIIGGVLLVVNLALPLLVRELHKERNTLVWETTGAFVNSTAWLFAMPLLLGLSNLLPRAKGYADLFVRKGYFPLVLFAIWTLVTATHLYCVGYVYELKWTISFLTPMLWVAAWTVRNRLNDFDLIEEESGYDWRDYLLIGPAAATLLAAFTSNWPVFFTLTILNSLFYALLLFRERNAFAFHLHLISVAFIFAGIPDTLLAQLGVELTRGQTFGASIAAYILLRAVLSASPIIGIVGSLTAGISAACFFDNKDYQFHLAVQIGMVFLIAHSLRWKDQLHAGAWGARAFVAGLWLMHTLIWLANDGSTAIWATVSFAGAILAVYAAVRFIFRFWASSIVPAAALAVLLSKPALLLITTVKDASSGLIALIASFLLFALGTIAALTKNRWHKNERGFPVNAQTNKAIL